MSTSYDGRRGRCEPSSDFDSLSNSYAAKHRDAVPCSTILGGDMETLHDTLTFEITTERLDRTIAVLEVLPAQSLYPVAWRVLTTEAARRKAGGQSMP